MTAHAEAAELAAQGTQRRRKPFIVITVDRVWRFFCSVRAALYEIVFLAILVLIGTLNGSTIPAQIPRVVPALEPLVMRWYAFDVFHSLIFSLTLALIATAITVCTINRVPGIWQAIAHPSVVTTRQFFRAAEPAVLARSPNPPEAVAADLVAILRSRRYRVLSERRGAEIHVYADKHRWGKIGTFPFHLALILLLIGGIVGSQFGFREPIFTIAEGSTRAVGQGTNLRLQLERFVDTYSQVGSPTEYRSDVILYDGDREVQHASLTVNHPLTYNDITFYQSSFGQAAQLKVTDGNGNTVFAEAVPFDFVSRANGDAPAALVALPAQGLRLELFFPNLKLDAKPEIAATKLQPGELYAQARDARTNEKIGEGTVIAQGDAARLAGLDVQFVRERRFTLLQVAYNPGIPILFSAAFLLVLGLTITFAFPHRRLRALVTATAEGTETLCAPLAKRDWGAKRDFAHTLTAIETRLGSATTFERTSHAGD
jgi:cytochrome c biogenesis protein